MTADLLITYSILQTNYPNNKIVFFEGKFYLI